MCLVPRSPGSAELSRWCTHTDFAAPTSIACVLVTVRLLFLCGFKNFCVSANVVDPLIQTPRDSWINDKDDNDTFERSHQTRQSTLPYGLEWGSHDPLKN